MKSIYKLLLVIISISLINLSYSFADETEEDVKDKLPKLLGISNAGLEFNITIPPVYEETAGNNFTKIYITSNVETTVKLKIVGKGVNYELKTIPHGIVNFDLMPSQAQPFQYNWENNMLPSSRKYEGAAIQIESEHPIVVYVMCKYRFTSDGFLAVPNSGLGNDYIVAAYNDMGWMGQKLFPPISGIVAAYDNTNIEITMGGNNESHILLENSQKVPPGGKFQVNGLNKGDVFMFTPNGPFQDITGSRVTGDKPFSLITGHYCANIPLTNQWCDYTVEMQLPIETWGYEYHIPSYSPRRYNGIIRVFASEPNTDIYRDGEYWFTINTPGGIQDEGWVERRVWDKIDSTTMQENRPKNAVISSDKPINIMYYNTGTQEDQGIVNQADSDPFMMQVYPIEQYENEITFCTPGTYGGDRFEKNYLNVIFESEENGKVPEDLMFAVLTPRDTTIIWQKLSDVYGAEGIRFYGQQNGRYYSSKQILLEGLGVFKLKSEYTKIASYSFGFSPYESYGYPTAGAKKNIIVIDAIPPKVDITKTNNNSVEGIVDDSEKGEIDNNGKVNNIQGAIGSSGLGSIYLDASVSKNYNLTIEPFIAGMDKKTKWTLSVNNPNSDAIGRIVFSDRNGNDTNLVFTHKGLINSVENNTFEIANIFGEIYPNPSNNSNINVNYKLSIDGNVNIKLIDMNGKLVKNIIENEVKNIGNYDLNINTSNLQSGTYFIEITNENLKDTKQVVINK